MGTLWDCHTAMERVLETKGGPNFILVLENRRNLAFLLAKQLYDFFF